MLDELWVGLDEPGREVEGQGYAIEFSRGLEGRFAPRKRSLNVALIGGGNVGYMVAEQLQQDRANVTIIEKDEARGQKLASLLPKVLVLHGDGTDLELLEQERIEDADVLVAVTDDETGGISIAGGQHPLCEVMMRR